MRLIALSSLKTDAADAQQRYRDAEGALAAFDAKPIERVHSLLPYIIVSAVLFAALMVIQTLFFPALHCSLSLL